MRKSPPEIEYSKEFGVSLPSKGWVPAPRYVFRRNRILANLESGEGKKLIEIGPGPGALLIDFSKLGYDCQAWELSDHAAKIARSVHRANERIEISQSFKDEWKASFDVLVSCEVIEHIEDDLEAMTVWSSLLKKGGVAIISTPSDPEMWNSNDVWAGHYRRYTWESMIQLCRDSGLEPIKLESYGYPMVSITDKIRSLINRYRIKGMDTDDAEKQEATLQSGTNRSLEMKLFPMIDTVIGRWAFRRMFKLQERYLNEENGNGLLCFARKK